MISAVIILGIIIFIVVLVSGIIWAVREDEKEEKDKEHGQKNQ